MNNNNFGIVKKKYCIVSTDQQKIVSSNYSIKLLDLGIF